ncbi:PIG-L deacetylase family protein [Arthrobacter sp. VKM Ac-2550]|uniref:PIG-L deacetylase family protein n=1 Tax=Crystallibacter permensis TaxID=1938888 RepID=UPI0022272CB2|nr:PIG-L deacetylase family protein [Arthrobacter sp. VKM Ac-2550]MCW2132775.1 N-acetylglucosaminyl deacetylase, LmbE family [Arthrobacter sp. VKM Ac-2550]
MPALSTEAEGSVTAPERVLVFAAHPDDLDFGAAGTIARWTAAGTQVSYCIMTDGDAGGFDEAHRPEIVAMRAAEQAEAARICGVSDLHFLHQRDGFLEPSYKVVGMVVELMRKIRPDIVLAMHPERAWDRIQKSHPDHLACGEAVTRAVYPAVENPFAYPELAEAGLPAYKVPYLWFFGGPAERENHFVDITEFVDTKVQAIRIHASQHPDVERMDARVRSMLRTNARRGGLEEGRSAEAFHVVGINTPATIAGF